MGRPGCQFARGRGARCAPRGRPPAARERRGRCRSPTSRSEQRREHAATPTWAITTASSASMWTRSSPARPLTPPPFGSTCRRSLTPAVTSWSSSRATRSRAGRPAGRGDRVTPGRRPHQLWGNRRFAQGLAREAARRFFVACAVGALGGPGVLRARTVAAHQEGEPDQVAL